MLQNIGLILDIIGAAVLFVSTERLNSVIVKLLQHYRENATGFDRQRIPKEQIDKFDKNKKQSAIAAYTGVVLLIIGFVFQLLASNPDWFGKDNSKSVVTVQTHS